MQIKIYVVFRMVAWEHCHHSVFKFAPNFLKKVEPAEKSRQNIDVRVKTYSRLEVERKRITGNEFL